MGVLIAVGCTRSGDVVVVLDSTMGAKSVEVVALPSDPRTNAPSAPAPSSGALDSASRLRALDDSAAALDARFRAARDSLTADVQALDTADRRTRSYAVRYAGIRRRTLAAEAVRAHRDSIRARADRLRARLGSLADTTSAASADGGPGRTADGRSAERRSIDESSVTLSLAPGRWWIGVARTGRTPTRYDSVTVERGAVDTLRLRPPGP